MPHLKINNGSLYYEIHGKGKPLLLITGLGRHLDSWAPIIQILKQNNQIIIFDNRGSGKTKCFDNSTWSIKKMAEDACELIKELDIDRPSILGHSMGGAIAQEIALLSPSLIDKLILSSTSPHFNQSFCMAMDFMIYLSETNIPLEKQAENIFSWIYSPNFLSKEENIETLLSSFINNPHFPEIEDIKRQTAALKGFSSGNKLNEISAKTLILRGEKDIICQMSETNKLVEEIEDASYYCIKNAGHSSYVEHPEIFSKLSLDFINDNIK